MVEGLLKKGAIDSACVAIADNTEVKLELESFGHQAVFGRKK